MDGIEAPGFGATTEEVEAEEKRPLPKTGERPSARTKGTAGRPQISATQGGLLIGTAAFFDGAQFIIGALSGLTVILLPLGVAAGWIIDAAAWMTFFFWLHSLGSGMIKKGGQGAAGLGREPFIIIALAFGIEFIPIINALPAWTAAIATLVFRQRIMALASLAGPGGTASLLKKAIPKTKTEQQVK